MKRLLLIGGIISMVLPAMAETDLRDYHLINSNNPGTCSGPEGYAGFEGGNVTMSPLYVKKCDPGQYYDAQEDTPISNHPVWIEDLENSSNSVCKNPVTGETISGVDSESCATTVLDYYYVNACADVANKGNNRYYTPGYPNVNASGYLQSTPDSYIGTCPAEYPYLEDGHRAEEEDCYKYCGTEANPTAVSQATLDTLKATNAQYTGGREYYQGNDICTVEIAAVDGCKTGYTYVNLAGSANSQFYKCDIGEAANCAESNVPEGSIEPGHWVTVNVSGVLIYGTMAFESGTCNATVTHVKVGSGAKSAYTFGPINVGTGTSAADCFSVAAQMALGRGIAAHYANGVTTNYTFCMPNVVNITWNDVAEPDNETTCVYGGDLSFPTPEDREGYSFIGWTVGDYPAPTPAPSEGE